MDGHCRQHSIVREGLFSIDPSYNKSWHHGHCEATQPRFGLLLEPQCSRFDSYLDVILLILIIKERTEFNPLHELKHPDNLISMPNKCCGVCGALYFTWCAYMVSYISVHITPEKYSGRHTDQSQEPWTADQPSSAPQLKVRPKQKNQMQHGTMISSDDRKKLWL